MRLRLTNRNYIRQFSSLVANKETISSDCDCRKILWREQCCLMIIATSAMTNVGDVMSVMLPCGAFPDLMEP